MLQQFSEPAQSNDAEDAFGGEWYDQVPTTADNTANAKDAFPDHVSTSLFDDRNADVAKGGEGKAVDNIGSLEKLELKRREHLQGSYQVQPRHNPLARTRYCGSECQESENSSRCQAARNRY
jgi:hypothetical protein